VKRLASIAHDNKKVDPVARATYPDLQVAAELVLGG
jgi:hypothetical protein